MEDVAGRAGSSIEAAWVRQWPGEHYRLLAGLVDLLRPKLVVEVGTLTGLSALAIAHRLPENGVVVTYDIVPWSHVPGTALRKEDLATRISQELADLSDPAVFAQHLGILRAADLVFLDGPKDGNFEAAFLALLLPAIAGKKTYLLIDDIRVLEMVGIWEALDVPKLDLTSLGHWSGTGLALVE